MRPSSSIKLKPADPFDLIRWLARSQSDPRKAVAELVQNSLDANARHVTIERRRVRRMSALVIRDEGDGILPDLPREDATVAVVAEASGHRAQASASVQIAHGVPGSEEALESLVEILAHAERNLSAPGGGS